VTAELGAGLLPRQRRQNDAWSRHYLVPLPLHVQLQCDMGALEDAYRSGLYARLDGVDLDPMHDALVFSSMVVLAVDGCSRLCSQLHLEQQPAANIPLQPRSIDQIAA
jgi:hypothetical protein